MSRSYREQFLFFFLSHFVPFFPIPLFLFFFFPFSFFIFSDSSLRLSTLNLWNLWYFERVSTIRNLVLLDSNESYRLFNCDNEISSFWDIGARETVVVCTFVFVLTKFYRFRNFEFSNLFFFLLIMSSPLYRKYTYAVE